MTVVDMVFSGGPVFTSRAVRSRPTAVAVDDGRVVAVGHEEVLDLATARTEHVDLRGRMLLPGFQDAHIHPISGGIEANGCDLNAATSVEEYVATIRKYAEAHPNEPWIKGGGWAMSAFGPGALARKELIDAVVPDRPVILWSRDDPYCPPRFAERVAARVRGELVLLDCGHWWPLERPAEAAAALERFWSQHS